MWANQNLTHYHIIPCSLKILMEQLVPDLPREQVEAMNHQTLMLRNSDGFIPRSKHCPATYKIVLKLFNRITTEKLSFLDSFNTFHSIPLNKCPEVQSVGLEGMLPRI